MFSYTNLLPTEIEVPEVQPVVPKFVQPKPLHPHLQAVRAASRTVHLAPWMKSTWRNLAVVANAASPSTTNTDSDEIATLSVIAKHLERYLESK